MNSRSTFFNRTAGPAIQGKKRGDRMKNLKPKAFRKFVSLIPESVKARLKPVTEKIAEVMKK